jgi:hypothetical protein
MHFYYLLFAIYSEVKMSEFLLFQLSVFKNVNIHSHRVML